MLRYLRAAVFAAPVVMFATIASGQAAPVNGEPAPASPPPVAAQAPVAGVTEVATPHALSLEELGSEGGLQGTYVYAGANQNLVATNSGNTINAGTVGSGDISLAEGAFAGFAGIGNFVLNSGHNNNLQGSLSLIIVTP